MANKRINRRGRAALIDRRLRVQLQIFTLVFAVLIVLVAYRVAAKEVNPLRAMLGQALGIGLGRALARTKVLS